MRIHIQLNARNLSNAPATSTYGFKIPVRFIRALVQVDRDLAHHLQVLAGGREDTHTRELSLLWPLRAAPELVVHVSYTYTGRPLSNGSFSSQAHIAITNPVWTPWVTQALGGSFQADYFEGRDRDLIVISDA